MIKQNSEFLTRFSDKMGKHVGGLYTTWHDMYSTELSYRWLEENDYAIEVILETKYQSELTIYLVEHFVKWYTDALNTGYKPIDFSNTKQKKEYETFLDGVNKRQDERLRTRY